MGRLGLFLALACLFFAPRPAHARSLTFEDFDAKIEVRADGTVAVEERIRVRFDGQWNGILRFLRYGYMRPGGYRGQIRLEVDAVEDDAGNGLEFSSRRRRGHLRLKIRVPGASSATRTVVIRYRTRGVIRAQEEAEADYGNHDELYWNVTGNDWDFPITHASATVKLPDTVPLDSVQTAAYAGAYRTRGAAYDEARLDDGRIRFETTAPLLPGDGLTIVVGFEPGHVTYASPVEKVWWWVQANWYFFVPLLCLALFFVAWWVWGRDPIRHRTVIPEWEPPEGLRPSEVGVLVDDRLDQRDLTAAIVDLAVRRVLTIHEQEDDEWRLTLDRQALTRTKLEPYEKKLIHALFPDEETETELSSLKHKFVSGLKTIRDSTLDHLVGTGYFRKRPDRVAAKWAGWTSLVLIGLFILGLWQQPPWTYWVLSFGCIVGMFIIAAHMPRRTRQGLDALVRIKGMEEYLVTAEKERMKKLPMDHFERLLPYAIALGVHDRWAKAFAGLYDQPPEWYRSRRTGAFDTLDLNSRVNGMNRSVGANLLAGPRTATRSSKAGWSGGWSGGGGFGGGGSSGGGFGGGGGGGW